MISLLAVTSSLLNYNDMPGVAPAYFLPLTSSSDLRDEISLKFPTGTEAGLCWGFREFLNFVQASKFRDYS